MKKRDIYMAVAWLLSMTACSDDYFNSDVDQDYSEYIGYSINVTGSDDFQARSSSGSRGMARRLTIDPTGSSIGGRQLYLHTEVVDSIPQTVSRAKNVGSDTPSRGSIVIDSPDDIGISAVVFDGEKGAWPSDGSTLEAQMYMHNEQITAAGGWQTNRYWPRENDWIRFYAYSPYGALDATEYDNTAGLPAISTAEPTFAYTVNDEISKQQDLLVGSEQFLGGWCQTAPLEMSHALTAVRIHIAGAVNQFTINTITISGLQNHGTYTYNYNPDGYSVDANGDKVKTHDAGDWSDRGYKGEGESASYTVFSGSRVLDGTGGKDVNGKVNVKFFENDDTAGYVDATPGDMVLLMMPQVLTSEAEITITGTDEVLGKDVALTATIGADDNSKEWVKGKMVTYTLSFNSTKIEYFLTVAPDGKGASPYYGEMNRSFTVKAYKLTTTSGGERVQSVDWAIDKETIPGWVDSITSEKKYGTFKTVKEENVPTDTARLCYFSTIPTISSGSDSHTNLKGNSPLGDVEKNKPYDLSTSDGVYDGTPENTANCYMVKAAGYYTFPLVYGNAITGGNVNTEAFAPSGVTGNSVDMPRQTTNRHGSYNYEAGELVVPISGISNSKTTTEGAETPTATAKVTTLTKFFDHMGYGNADRISKPWIVSKNNRSGKYKPLKAEIVWQDEPCLVTDVKLSENGDYITFKVNGHSICEGNAVIAVREDNASLNNPIMWSWHIWVTDCLDYMAKVGGIHDFSSPTTIKNRLIEDMGTVAVGSYPTTKDGWGNVLESTFKIMRSSLGACDAETKVYDAQNATIKFKIIENGKEVTKNIKRQDVLELSTNEGTATTNDNAPYYQFGRKDPMLPTGGGNGSDKPYYLDDRTRKSGIKIFSQSPEDHTIGNSIRYPDHFFKGRNDVVTDPSGTTYVRKETWYSNDYVYLNLWNANFGEAELPMFSYYYAYRPDDMYNEIKKALKACVTKTVYDPCPPGYEMPRMDAFTGFTYEGTNFHPYLENGVVSNYVNTEIGLLFYPAGYGATSDPFLAKGISFYCNPKPSTSDFDGSNGTFFLHFTGHRNNAGKVAMYNSYSSALVATPTCIQWMTNDYIDENFNLQGSRLCVLNKSIRVMSASDFDLAFPVMPAKTGCNPSTTTIDTTIGWSDDDDHSSDSDVDF